MARKAPFHPDVCVLVVEHLLAGGTQITFCDQSGIPHGTFRGWIKDHLELRDAVQSARQAWLEPRRARARERWAKPSPRRRPKPSDFRTIYIQMGWDGIMDHYGCSRDCVSRWIEEEGRDDLFAARRAHVLASGPQRRGAEMQFYEQYQRPAPRRGA
jgi:hypothetical protein